MARKKLASLLPRGAKVYVVASQVHSAISRMARDGKISWIRRPYRQGDIKGKSIVIAATNDVQLQKKIAKDAKRQHVLVNVVDVPRLCDFIAPAIFQSGDIQIAISTGGAAPAVAKYLRKKVALLIGKDDRELVHTLKKMRPRILKLSKDKRRSFWDRVARVYFHES